MYLAAFAGSEDHASQVRDDERARLQRILADVARRQDNVLRQVQECDPGDPFARGLRQTFGDLGAQRAATLAAVADLDRVEAAEPDRPHPDDVTLLDCLPHLAVNLRAAPESLLRSLFEITGLTVALHAGGKHATITAKVPADHVKALAEMVETIAETAGQEPGSAIVLDAVRAPGTARTASKPIDARRELLVSTTVEIPRRRRR
ncbi:MAG: hypothetical protein J2P17_34505 [Mycobacterium sp.]|nr:hypothetical protein [Mycobacterium sp.]